MRGWLALDRHAARMRATSLRALCADPAARGRHVLSVAGLRADFSRQLIDDAALDALLELASSRRHGDAVRALVGGEVVNPTEGRPALHTALRDLDGWVATPRAAAAARDAAAARERMRAISASWSADPDVPRHRARRYRWLRPRAASGLRGARGPWRAALPGAFPRQCRRPCSRCAAARARSEAHPRVPGLEELRHPGDPAQRRLAARMAGRGCRRAPAGRHGQPGGRRAAGNRG